MGSFGGKFSAETKTHWLFPTSVVGVRITSGQIVPTGQSTGIVAHVEPFGQGVPVALDTALSVACGLGAAETSGAVITTNHIPAAITASRVPAARALRGVAVVREGPVASRPVQGAELVIVCFPERVPSPSRASDGAGVRAARPE